MFKRISNPNQHMTEYRKIVVYLWGINLIVAIVDIESHFSAAGLGLFSGTKSSKTTLIRNLPQG